MFRPYDWRTQAAREQCVAAGCEVREVVPLPLPPGVGGPPSYACEHFAECWSKLRVWELEDERGQQVDIVASRQRCSSSPPPLLPLLGLALPRQGRSSPPLPRETGTVALVAALRTLEERPLRSAPNGRPGQHSLFQGARRPQPRPSLRSLRVVTARVWAALLLLSILLRWPGSSSSCCSTPTWSCSRTWTSCCSRRWMPPWLANPNPNPDPDPDPNPNPNPDQELQRARDTLKAKIHDKFRTALTAFRSIDTDHSGTLSYDEIVTAVKSPPPPSDATPPRPSDATPPSTSRVRTPSQPRTAAADGLSSPHFASLPGAPLQLARFRHVHSPAVRGGRHQRRRRRRL